MDVDVSGVMACSFIYFICYRRVDWLIHCPKKAVVTVVYTNYHTLWWIAAEPVHKSPEPEFWNYFLCGDFKDSQNTLIYFSYRWPSWSYKLCNKNM